MLFVTARPSALLCRSLYDMFTKQSFRTTGAQQVTVAVSAPAQEELLAADIKHSRPVDFCF